MSHHASTMSRSRSYHDEISGNSESIESIPMEQYRTRSWGKSMARKAAVNFMPSRHLSYYGGGKRKMDENLPFLDAARNAEELAHVAERRAEIIAQEMEKDDNLMLDDPDAEQLRIEALRNMPQCLTVKRSVKARISASISLKSKRKPIGYMKRLKYRISFWFKKMNRNTRDFIFSIELWYEAIRTVEGHFGSGVATYFYFLRWLFVMGAFVSIFVIAFLLVPQVLLTNALRDNSNTQNQSSNTIAMDLITGQGILENTTLFYGHYSPYVVNVITSLHYSIPYAYFFTMLLLYFAFFVLVSVRMALSYRRSFIETGSDFSTIYANKVFCGWDFGIATVRAASLKSSTIYNELKELLSDSLKNKQKEGFIDLFVIFLKQTFFHVLVLIMLVLVGVLMWVMLDNDDSWLADFIVVARNSKYKPIITASVVTLIMVFGPLMFSYLSRFEDYYNPRTNLYITLLRTFLLEAVVLIVLNIFWIRSDDACWYTSLGQEIYRLVIFEFVFSVVIIPISELLRSLINRVSNKRVNAPDFDIARNTLGLIYNQTLMWMGLFFSPLIAAIVTIKLAILFYVKKASVLYNCHPAGRAWRASQTQTVFLMLVFVSQLAIILTLGYILSSKSSRGCGPFQDHEYIYLLVVNDIFGTDDSNIFFAIFEFLMKPGVVAFILIFIGIFVNYLRARAVAQKSMVAILREMLVMEAKDKEFLLTAIAKVTEGEWSYNLKEDTVENNYDPDTGHDWNFLRDKKPSNAGFQFVNSPRNHVVRDQPSSSSNASKKWNARKVYYGDDLHDSK